MSKPLDLVIAGVGPSGVSAALWAHTFGLSARVFERGIAVGGQLALVRFHPAELPGVTAGTGPEIAAVCAAQLAAAGVFAECGREVAGLEAAGACVRMRLTSGDRIEARALLIATGLRRRRLRVPGEAELADRGVSYSARRDREAFAGREVVVVGGGDGAFENALMLAAVGCRVLLLIRGRARARPSFEARVAAEPAIVVREQARIVAFEGDVRLEAVTYEAASVRTQHPAVGAVIKIGMLPNSEWCGDAVARDAEGYVRVDTYGRTTLPLVWASGDVTRPVLPSIATAIGSAAAALADIRVVLEGVSGP